jgi:site-specific DNA recombinase
MLQCAIYARFSSDRQSTASIADQIRKCREYAARLGWTILEDHIYTDQAVSGASMEREGLTRLMECATSPNRPFDCILIDDTSRLSRRLADALNLYERLTFAGVRVVAVSQGVDTQSPQAELLAGVHGLIDSVYSRELAQKTHRGMEGCAAKGLPTGGRCFGYQTVRLPDGSARLDIKPDEAATVRRIFEMSASGMSYKRIAHALNGEGVRSPKLQKGRISRSWCTSAIRVLLMNKRYVGKQVWNTRRKVRVPGTGKRVYRSRPEAEWIIADVPDQRIVSDELWAAVLRRLDTTKKLWGREGRWQITGRHAYLFSGLLQCAECGGSITLVAGHAGKTRAKYGCSHHWQRGNTICTNSLLISRDELEVRLLAGLQKSVLREDMIDYAVKQFERQVQDGISKLDDELARLRKRKAELHEEVNNLAEAVAKSGYQSPALIEKIAERERELREITDRLLEPRGSIRTQIAEIRAFAVAKLQDIRKLLSDPEKNVLAARSALAEQFGKITLKPVQANGRMIYTANGKVDFLQGAGVARLRRAGGQS